MSDETKNPDFDLDEDLFDFGEASLADVFDGDDDADLDEIFAAFQEAQLDEPEDAPTVEENEPEFEDDLDEFFQPDEAGLEEKPRATNAPAANGGGHEAEVWTPETAIDGERGGSNGSTAAQPRASRPRVSPASGSPANQAGPVLRTGLSRTALWALVGVTSLNALVALVMLSNMSSMRNSVVEVGRHVSATADEMRTGSYEQSRVLNELQTPVVPFDAEEHPTFDRARAEITQGQYSEARRRLYALLSIIDRLDPEQRDKVEARAQYLLAEALHLEALERMEAEQ